MSAFAIIVDFRLKPGQREAFRRLIDANARDSATLERGCQRFDVLEPAEGDDRVLLYEIYDDRAAFDQHVESGHFARFDRESSEMVVEKLVTQCSLVFEATNS